MSLKTRLSRLEASDPKPSRLIELHPDAGGQPTVVSVIGGNTFYRENYASGKAFWADIHAADERAWAADPHNPDPLGSLFRYVANHGKRLGDAGDSFPSRE